MKLTHSQLGLGLLFVVFSWCLTSCQQTPLCQDLKPVEKLAGSSLRLISTDNPQFARSLNNVTFPIFNFDETTFTGRVFLVKNNFQVQNPSLNFSYSATPIGQNLKRLRLVIQFYTPPATQSNNPDDLGTKSGAPETYEVVLTNYVDMTTLNPNTYRYGFIPMAGSVSPEKANYCTFRR